ncbi:MAG: T9SS type A sorting domain-containing protein, partial [candidate division WOR-3 bacterium]
RSAGANWYQLQVSDNPGFSSPAIDVSQTETSYTPAASLADGHWYWRARASAEGGIPWGAFSGAFEFDLDATPPPSPVLRIPAHHEVLTSVTPRFVWGKVVLDEAGRPAFGADSRGTDSRFSGTTIYRLQVDTSSVFSRPAIDATIPGDTFFQVRDPSPLFGGSFNWYWRVMATDTAGNPGSWSTVRDFRIMLATVGWLSRNPIPPGPRGKNVKDGGALAYHEDETDGEFVYAFKGNNTSEFYCYSVATGNWETKESIPPFAVGATKKKYVKKGSALANGGRSVYGVKGNNTDEFWRYDPFAVSYYPWVQRASVPLGAWGKRLKEGVGMAGVLIDTTTFVYLLKGSNTTEFFRYDPRTDQWSTMASAPGGSSGKGYKAGSCIAYAPDTRTIYALKGTYNEFFAYDVAANTWQTKSPLPYALGGNRKKKVKDGAGLAYNGGYIYALKGGNTCEFYRYDPLLDRWESRQDIPIGGGRRVKNGGSLTSSARSIFALKGNNTPEFWQYDPTPTFFEEFSDVTAGAQAGQTGSQACVILDVVPNPFVRRTRISFGLARGSTIALRLYDASGCLVAVLKEGQMPAGVHSVELASGLARGIYLLRLTTGGHTAARKLIVE